MVEIIPGILEQDFAEIKRKIGLVEPYVSTVQIDIADGQFVANKTILDPLPFQGLETKLTLELHLMTQNPAKGLSPWSRAGFSRIIGHVEAENIREFVTGAQVLGFEVGLAINPETSYDRLEPYLIELDLVQVMAIDPGAQGRTFQPESLKKIRQLRKEHPNLVVAVDGGINPEVAPKAIEAGATRLVSGSYLFSQKSIVEAIRRLSGGKN